MTAVAGRTLVDGATTATIGAVVVGVDVGAGLVVATGATVVVGVTVVVGATVVVAATATRAGSAAGLPEAGGVAATGAGTGATVTVKVPVVVWAKASVAVHVTVVTPTGNTAPEAGAQVGVPLVAVAARYVTATPAAEVAVADWLLGRVSTGAAGLFTVTMKVAVVVCARLSVVVQVTVVIPMGKVVPDAGAHDGVPALAVGDAYVTTAPADDVAVTT